MTVKVKANVPEGEAVQVHFGRRGGDGMNRIEVPNSAPHWFREWVADVYKCGYLESLPFIPLPGPMQNHYMSGLVSGWWLVRSEDGQLIGIPPDQFDCFYKRQPREEVQHDR